MFRDVYKSANNDIIPDSQLLDNILANTPKKKNAIYRTYTKYGSLAAAFIILIGTLSIYPRLSKTLNETKDNTIVGTDAVFKHSQEEFEPVTSEKPIISQEQETEKASTDIQIPVQEIPDTKNNTKKANITVEGKTKEKSLPKVKSSPSPTQSAQSDVVNFDSVSAGSSKNRTDFDCEPVAVLESMVISDENSAIASETKESQIQDSDVANTENIAVATEENLSAPAAFSARMMPESNTEQPIGESSEGTEKTQILKSKAFSPENTEISDDTVQAVASGGGGQAAKPITESLATEIADNTFLADFGEDFLNSSKIKIEFNENYIISRYNENVTYTVEVLPDGTLNKLY